MTNSPKFPKNSNYKSITFYTQTGEKVSVNKGTLFQNLCAASVLLKEKGVVALTYEWFKGDLEEFLAGYNNRRPVTATRVNTYTKDRNSGLWVDHSPSLQIDWNGKPINGGHSIESALKADQNTALICTEVGIDPRMDARTDTGKPRPPRIQAYYVDELRLAERLPNGADVANFGAAARLIWLYICRYDSSWDETYSPTESVQRICHTPLGQSFLAKLLSYFVEVKEVLDKANAKHFKNVRFYVPILMLCLAEEEEYLHWAASLAKGTGMKSDRLLEKCRDLLLEVCTVNAKTSGADQLVRPDVERALILLYAKVIKADVQSIVSSVEWRERAINFFVNKIVSSLRC